MLNLLICKMMFLNILLIFLLKSFSSMGSKNVNVEENVLKEILLELDTEDNHLYDPNDMLAPPKVDPSINKKNIYDFDENVQQGHCAFENMKIGMCNQELELCSMKYADLQSEVMMEKNKTTLLLEKLSESNHVDVGGFYTRILHKFWNLLNMETNEKYLQMGNNAIIQHLAVKLSAKDIAAFKEIFEGGGAHIQVDLFFAENFEVEEREEMDILQSIKNGLYTLYSQLRTFELWLSVIWMLIVLVLAWGFYLFILDIQRELRWRRVLLMVIVLAFLVSYVYHWRHMIKVRESQRHSLLTKMELNNPKSGCMKEDTLWSMIKENVFGAQSDCEKYHEKIMIPAAEEISPMMVLSETISKFILLPLQDLGLHFGLFFRNFYKNVPLLWQIPATLVFLIIVFTFIFAFFGYGIYFPLWLGGIRPSRAEDNPDKFKQLIKESEERIKSMNKAMIEEAKETLTQISYVAISQSQNSPSQPSAEAIVQTSTSILEKKLEYLINQKLSSALDLHSSRNLLVGAAHDRQCVEVGNRCNNFKIIGDVVDWKSLRRTRSDESTICSPIPIPWKPVKDKCQRSGLEEATGESVISKKEKSCRDLEPGTSKKHAETSCDDDDDFLTKIRSVLGDG